jgi:hypothetical protein
VDRIEQGDLATVTGARSREEEKAGWCAIQATGYGLSAGMVVGGTTVRSKHNMVYTLAATLVGALGGAYAPPWCQD